MEIEQIRTLLRARKIGWSFHSAQMMQKRDITRLDVLHCLENGENDERMFLLQARFGCSN